MHPFKKKMYLYCVVDQLFKMTSHRDQRHPILIFNATGLVSRRPIYPKLKNEVNVYQNNDFDRAHRIYFSRGIHLYKKVKTYMIFKISFVKYISF